MPVQLCNYTDIYYNETIHTDLTFMSATATPEQIKAFTLRAGDTVITKDSETADDIGIASHVIDMPQDLVCGYHLAILRPGPRVDPRFLTWAMRSGPVRRHLAANATGMTRMGLTYDAINRSPIPLLDLVEQQRIADFLDDQVSRIDRVMGARRMEVRLVRESRRAELETLLGSAGEGRPLAALTDPARPIQYGIVLPGPDFPGGVPIIKGGDIGARRLHPEFLRRTDPEIDRAYSRSRVREGDVVIAIRGSVGEVAAVPDTLTGANLTQDSARIAPRGVDSGWLLHVLQTPTVQARVARMIVGATVRGVNIADLRRVVVPTPGIDDQTRLAKLAQSIDTKTLSVTASLENSVNLLEEYKQSLVTAAVTGEIDVTTASGRSIPA